MNSHRRFLAGAHVAAAFAALLLVTSCDRLRRAGSTPDDEEPAGAQSSSAVPAEFAESLDIDLSAMSTLPSGLYVQDLVEGRGLAARSGHVVVVRYTGWLPNGDEIDSTSSGESRSFQLGARRDVIAGWEEGVTGMRIGGKRRLVIPPNLAYGARGVPGAIPPNATLIYEFELLDIRM